MIVILKEEMKNKSQIETNCLIQAKRLDKIIEHKYRLIQIKVRSNYHKYGIVKKIPILKGF
jgi:hypothetical protein